jgi:hypothetical protein
MKVGPDNSIYSLFTPRPHNRTPSINDENISLSSTPTAKPPLAIRNDQEMVADFHAHMAKQALEWADADKDRQVTKQEFMDGQARLAELNEKPCDPVADEAKWNAIDVDQKGWVNEDDLSSGLQKTFPVKVGHFDPAYAERLRDPRA